MRNKFNISELVIVSGKGKLYGKVENKLGVIITKDMYYKDYYIKLIFGRKDWFSEKSIKTVLESKGNQTNRFQVRLCTTIGGYELILKNMSKIEPLHNNKMEQVDILKKFKKDNKQYIILGWESNKWASMNKSVDMIEETIFNFRRHNIPYQYVVMNEENLTDIEISEFTANDSNVKVFTIKREIKIKYRRYKKHDSTKTV